MMLIKRWYSVFTIFLLFLSHVSFIQAQNSNPNFSCTAYYIYPEDPRAKSIFNQIINSSFGNRSSHQNFIDNHQRYVHSELQKTVILEACGKRFYIQPEDKQVIDKICTDNPHKSSDVLKSYFAVNPAINDFQGLYPHGTIDRAAGFAQDIFIDKNHFNKVKNIKHRIKKLENAAKAAMKQRHKLETDNLELQHKSQMQTVKNGTAAQQHTMANDHEKALGKLDAKHVEEKKHPLGIKYKPTQNSNEAPPLILVSNIARNELQDVFAQNQSVTINNRSVPNSSFDKVMHDRSQSLQSSLSNAVPTDKQMKINPQTIGFLQAQGIDTAQFQQAHGLPIQHQLTHELINVLDSVANYSLQNHQSYQLNLTQYCAHVASLTQQSNMQGALTQAVQGTNCCHGLYHYMNGCVENAANAYHEMTIALQYFNPVLEYGGAIAQGVMNGAVKSGAVVAVTAVGLAVAPVATTLVLQAAVIATAVTLAPLCLQACINTYDFGKCCIAGEWDKVDAYLDATYTCITNLENVEKAAELVTGVAVAYNSAAIMQSLQSLTTMRPVIATVYQPSGQVTRSMGLMTAAQLEQELIATAETLQMPDLVNFNMYHKNIFGCDFFTIAPQSHPALAPILEIAGIPGMINAVEQELITEACLTLSQVASSTSLMTVNVNQAAQEQIAKAVTCLSKVVSDLVKKGIGLENLSYDEMDLIARVVKKARNIDIHRSGDLSEVNVKFTDNSRHMFDNREGHRPDSPEFRAEIMDTVKNVKNYHGSDINNNDWYSEILFDGTQRWALVCKNIIKNGGINEIPKEYNPISGLSKLIYPLKK